jgi:pyruvate/2-oxoglutarate dehydrogenase complex dihydrolipoamide acyltransferase (E2) component
MTAPETKYDAPAEAAPASSEADVCERILELADSGVKPVRRYRELIGCVTEHFNALHGAIEIATATATISATAGDDSGTSNNTKQLVHAAILEAQTEGTSIGRVYNFPKTGDSVGVLAVPVPTSGQDNCGALGLVVPCGSKDVIEARLAELRALLWLLTAQQRQQSVADGAAATDDSAATRAMVRAASYETLHHMAFALANRLKERFGCEQAAVGSVRRGRVQVAAISGMDVLHPRTPGTIRIRQAMEECLDRRAVVCVQFGGGAGDATASTGHRLHKQWSDAVGGGSVLSIPIPLGDEIVAIVSLLRSVRQPFTTDDVRQLGDSLVPLGGAIRLVDRSSRGVTRHAVDAAIATVRTFAEPGRWPRRIALVAGSLAGLWFCFGTMDYVVTVPCRIAPTTSYVMSAPFQGKIAKALVDVGDDVSAGAVLYEMDTRDLTLEQNRLRSEISVAKLRHAQALTAGDRLEASLAAADVEVLQSDLAVIDHQLSEAVVRAISAGTVLAGDLQDHVGDFVPVGAPMVELAARDDWRLELDVLDSVVGVIDEGDAGWFVCNARPELAHNCRVRLVHPAAQSEKGETTFVVEASAEERPDWMRVGMEGVARLDTGRRPIWWVYLHRIIDFVRLHVWV